MTFPDGFTIAEIFTTYKQVVIHSRLFLRVVSQRASVLQPGQRSDKIIVTFQDACEVSVTFILYSVNERIWAYENYK